MDIDNFFSGKPIKRKVVSSGTTQQNIQARDNNGNSRHQQDGRRIQNRYAAQFVNDFKNEIWRRFDSRLDEVRPIQIRKERKDRNDQSIFSRYTLGFKEPTNLPIEEHQIEILEKIRRNTVTILSGPTGCGKTTQVPQYIFDEHCIRDEYCNIIVAQPRRIAAINNAKRVCAERDWKLGTLVGYQIGSDERQFCGTDTRILFCTTGILVEKLLHGHRMNPLDSYTHVILDEVHERDKDMDFLMILIYKYLNPNIRIILMSATIDVNKFKNYYEIPNTDVPVLQIDVQRRFTVQEFYLDDLDMVVDDEVKTTPQITEQMWRCAERLVAFFEHIDRKEALRSGTSAATYEKNPKPTVLIFLPGMYEIEQMYKRLERYSILNAETKIIRLILHSTIEPMMSELAMQKLSTNCRKIILATNMAESSITVPDVKYVIDFCLTKTLVVDAEHVSSLTLNWASRANCIQRAGRTGRVMNGRCFRLVSKNFYTNVMDACAKPELLTSPLENIVLKTKQMRIGKPEEVLALALDKPKLDQIAKTVIRLKEMGALLCTTKGKFVERDGDLTNIGEFMTRLPIDVKLSKLILWGYCFGVLEECIVIAAALNCTRPIYKPNINKPLTSYTKSLEFANGSGSDLFAMLNAYNTWKAHRHEEYFGNVRTKDGQRKEASWANANCLDVHALHECDASVRELRVRVRRMNLCELNTYDWNDNEKYIILKVVIAGAFYPNFFSRSSRSCREFIEHKFKTLDGKDPCNTVYFTGFKSDKFPHIYLDRIRQIFTSNMNGESFMDASQIHQIKVTHNHGSEKIFVTFQKNGKEHDIKKYGVACQPGFVLTEVFKAHLLRSTTNEIPIFSRRLEAMEYAEAHQLRYKDDSIVYKDCSEYNNYCFPRKFDKVLSGYIVHSENCGRFWFQPKYALNRIESIHDELNHGQIEPFRQHSDVKLGQIVAANFPDRPNRVDFHRGKIMSIDVDKRKEKVFNVQFLDFGNSRICRLNELRKMTGLAAQYVGQPPCCFECSLANIQPSQMSSPNGVWCEASTSVFLEKTDGIEIEAEVYSCVNGIVRITARVEAENINDYLISKNLAEFCEESVISKRDHLEREKAQRLRDPRERVLMSLNVIEHLRHEDTPLIKAPGTSQMGMHRVQIKGPISPLRIDLFGLAKSTAKIIKIAKSSVNNILLENEPNDMSEKYLVAVHACQTNEASNINLRYTTQLPNIRLFGPLMAAIFAPRMRLQRNEKNTQFLAMLTGLGCDNKGVPISANTDLKFDLDAALSKVDLERINRIRQSLNYLISETIFPRKPINIRNTEVEFETIKASVISLFTSTRMLIADEFSDISWNVDDTLAMKASEMCRIFPLHEILRLRKPNLENLLLMKKACDQLNSDARADIETTANSFCTLCNKHFQHLPQHLLSRQHKDLIDALEKQLENTV